MKRHFFATALAATAISLCCAGSGKAVVLWFAGVDIPIPTTPAGVYVDLNSGATSTSPFAGGDANFFFGGFVIGNEGDLPAVPEPTWQPVRLAADNAATIGNLPAGTLVGPGSLYGNDFGGSFTHIPAEFTSGTPGYIGFSLDTGSGPLYGWMLVTLEANTAEGVIHTWVIQDNGNPIIVGIPEPGTSLLALLGLGGLALRRRRR